MKHFLPLSYPCPIAFTRTFQNRPYPFPRTKQQTQKHFYRQTLLMPLSAFLYHLNYSGFSMRCVVHPSSRLSFCLSRLFLFYLIFVLLHFDDSDRNKYSIFYVSSSIRRLGRDGAHYRRRNKFTCGRHLNYCAF